MSPAIGCSSSISTAKARAQILILSYQGNYQPPQPPSRVALPSFFSAIQSEGHR